MSIEDNYKHKYINNGPSILTTNYFLEGGAPLVYVVHKKSQDIAADYARSGKKIGILIAGNAGRPGGALVDPRGEKVVGDFHRPFKTQEEDVISSWLQGEERQSMGAFDPDSIIRDSIGITANYTDRRGQPRRGQPWGLHNPDLKPGNRGFHMTVQEFDYTRPFHDRSGRPKFDQAGGYNFSYALQDKPVYSKPNNALVKVDLVFVFGPNVAYYGTPYGSGARTQVSHYQYDIDYDVFRLAVKTALFAGLAEMQKNNNKIAILCPISGGIYSGKGSPTNIRINKEYMDIINEILSENPDLNDFFDEIIFSHLNPHGVAPS